MVIIQFLKITVEKEGKYIINKTFELKNTK